MKQELYEKKRQEINMANDAAKTLVNMSNSTVPVYISRRKVRPTEEALKEAKEELRKLKLLKEYKSVKESLKNTLLDTIKQLDEVDKEINDLISEIY